MSERVEWCGFTFEWQPEFEMPHGSRDVLEASWSVVGVPPGCPMRVDSVAWRRLSPDFEQAKRELLKLLRRFARERDTEARKLLEICERLEALE